jgi:DNA-binding ferritin-like protein (Dps family)
MHNGCNCKICRRYREYQEKIKRVPKEDREFWEKIFERLYMVEEEKDYAELIQIPRLEEQIERKNEAIIRIRDVLDEYLGDSDYIPYDYTDDDIKREQPVVWCVMECMRVLSEGGVMNKKDTSFDMLTKTDIEKALGENSGLTDKHRAQILAGVYREAIEALKEIKQFVVDYDPVPEANEIYHIALQIIEKYPKEE